LRVHLAHGEQALVRGARSACWSPRFYDFAYALPAATLTTA
jgi:hypothetical protein